jgi:hypothetical protein
MLLMTIRNNAARDLRVSVEGHSRIRKMGRGDSMVNQRITWDLNCGIGSLLELAGEEISFIRTREVQWPSCGDSTSQSASRQITGSRYRIYAKRQAP